MDAIRAAHWAEGEFSGTSPAEMAGQGAAVKRLAIRAGHTAARHHHPFEQFLYVAAGGGLLQCEAGEVVLAPGTVVHLPAGAWHSAVFPEATVLIEVNLNEPAA